MTKRELILAALLVSSLLSGSAATAQNPCDQSSSTDEFMKRYETPKTEEEMPQYVPGDGRSILDQTCQKVGSTIMCY
jgi:hypothetical protein